MKRLQGIHTDSQPIDQPKGTYRDAKNILLTKKLGSISTEEGTESDQDATGIPSGYEILGDTLVHDGRHIIFITDGTDSEVGIFDGDSYSDILDDQDLNFQSDSNIDATTTVDNNGDVIVYWTDNINPPRFYNIDTTSTYGDVTELNLFPYISSPLNFSVDDVSNSGGVLTTGAYYFAFSYIDEDNTSTNFFTVTSPVYIRSGSGTDGFGDPPGTPTGKAIDITLDDIDQSYKSIRIAVIREEAGVIEQVSILPDKAITSSSQSFTYSGSETDISGSLDEIIINSTNYPKVKTLAQINNVLYIGNLERNSSLDYQKFANNIKVEAVSKTAPIDYSKDEDYVYLNKSFKRDEVYAFYISFLLNDGSESYAFHIPGRAIKDGEDDNIDSGTSGYGQDVEDIDPNNKAFQFEETPDTENTNMNYWENENEVYPNTEDFEVWDVDYNGDGFQKTSGETDLGGKNVRHHHFPSNTIEPCVTDSDSFSLLGIRFKNIKIPSSIREKIKGIKIYYAKRTNNNKRILDQSLLTGRRMSGSAPNLTYTNFLPNPSDGSDQFHPSGAVNNDKAVAAIPFNLMRTKESIGALTHLKQIATPKVDGNSSLTTEPDTGAAFLTEFIGTFYSNSSDYQTVVADDFIRKVDFKGYADSHIEEVNLTQLGFPYDANTFKEESKIWISTDRYLEVGAEYLGTNQDYRLQFISDLFAHKVDVYNSFDQQQLVWTGYLETDLSKFDPSDPSYNPGTNAEGVITITGAASPETYASCSSIITGAPNSAGSIDFTYDGNTVNVSVDGNEPIDILGDKIVTDINADGNITISCSFDSGTDTLTFTAETIGSSENGKEVTIVDNGTNTTFDDLSPSMSGGISGTEGELSLNVANFGGSKDLQYDVQYGDDKDTIATELYNSFSMSDYDAVLDTNPSNPTITITAEDAGSEFNTDIATVVNATVVTLDGVSESGDEISGGTDPSHWTTGIYNGDTFINLYGVRVSEEDDENRLVYYYVCESQDNISLRYNGENYGETFYPSESLIDITTLEDNDNQPNDEVWYDNFIGYNQDYSTHQDIKTAPPRPKRLEETLKFPTRVARSQGGDISNIENNFRTFLENDYIDLQRDRGELTKLSVLDNVLIPHMRRSLIRTKGREELVTGDIRTFIGSGDIFSVKPDEIMSTEAGFAGLQDFKSAITTPYGYFFVDRKANKVFLVNQQPKEISSNGLRTFFEEELQQVDDNELIATWDDKWDRILLTFKGSSNNYPNGWTLSYYPQLEVWGSFHSYTPEYYLNGLTTFYSLQEDKIYEHNISSISGSFYGDNEESYIEFIDNRSPLQSKYFSNIEMITEVVDESTNEKFYKETFDKFQISNSYQDSGEQDIIYFDQPNGNARHVEGTWKINKFRNMLVNGSIDMNKPWQDQSRLIGKYARVKLIYNNSDNKFLYLNDAKVGMRVSVR